VAIAVRVNGPEGSAIGPEVVRLAPTRTARQTKPGTPPLLGEVDPDPAAERHLSYAALADFQRCGYRYYVERVLGLRVPGADNAPGSDEDGLSTGTGERDEDPIVPDAERAEPGARERRLGFGNAVHALLERSARTRWARPGVEAVQAALRREGLTADPEESERAHQMIDAWLGSELFAEASGLRGRPRPEVPFLLPIGAETIVRGTIDLLVERPGEPPLFVDYKTDSLRGSDPADVVAERYEIQRGLYGLAIAKAAGVEQVEAAYVFLERPDPPLRVELGPDELGSAAERLAHDIEGVRSGSFEVTPEPHAALCFDCPARERLCSYGPERTLAPT
jgi:hypothetical protein